MPWGRGMNYPTGAVTYMVLAADTDKGGISTIINGIAPKWGPFGALGDEAKVMIEVVMAVAILLASASPSGERPSSASARRRCATRSAQNRARV